MKTRALLIPALLLVCAVFLILACNGSGSYSVRSGAGRLDIHLTDAPIEMSNVSSVVVTITSVLVYPGAEGMDCDDDDGDVDDHDDGEGDDHDEGDIDNHDDRDMDHHDDADDDADDDHDDDGDDDCDEDAPPIVVSTHPETFDLLTLTGGVTELLASGEVPAGFYKKIRLEISSATLTYADGTTVPLKIESNKVDVKVDFQVTDGEDAAIVLDFDAAASVKVNETGNGELILRPVVKVRSR